MRGHKFLITITSISLLVLTGCVETSSFSSTSSVDPSVLDYDQEDTYINDSSDPNMNKVLIPGGTYEYISGRRMPLPVNKENMILASPQEEPSMYQFNDKLPAGFRAIYGNNFYAGDYYATGELKFGSATTSRKGFQTPFFNTYPNLVLSLCIGQMTKNSQGSKINTALPVIAIYSINRKGVILHTDTIDKVNESNSNREISIRLDGTNVSYIEVRVVQSPYNNTTAYNFGMRGIYLYGI